MAKKPSHQCSSSARHRRAGCESVHFAEVDFTKPVVPRLVIQFEDGLSLLLEDESAIGLAAEFIGAFRTTEKGAKR